ncbi:MAG: hypothetical protein FWG93_06920 [Oscillospiraceae bacterium]|nr:hypothetical protein [Oscillospiraceae bacterium]
MDAPLTPTPLLRAGIVITAAAPVFMGLSAALQLAREPEPRWLYAFGYALFAVLLALGAARGLRKRPGVFLAVLSLAAFGAALAVALWARTEPAAEYERMFQAAMALRNGQWDALRRDDYFLVWAYQSGFVLFQALILRVFPAHIVSLLVVNALVMAGINAALYLLLRRVCSAEVSILVSVLYLCAPPPYFLASVLTNQHISLLCLLLALCFSGRRPVASGICLALACAMRPDAALAYPALVISALLLYFCERDEPSGKRKWKWRDFLRPRAAPGGLMLSVVTGVAAGLLLSGLVMLSGLNPYGLENRDPLWKLAVGLNVESEGRFSFALTDHLMQTHDPAERAVLEREVIRDNLSRGAPAMASFLLRKLSRSWREYEPTYWAFYGQEARQVPLLNRPLGAVLPVLQQAERLLLLLLALAGAGGLIQAFRRGAKSGTALSGLMTVGFMLIHLFIEFQPRYRYMLWPFVYLLAAGGFGMIAEALTKTGRGGAQIDTGRSV